MGILKAVTQAIGGGLADQWLEVYEADDMGEQTVFTSGVLIRKGQKILEVMRKKRLHWQPLYVIIFLMRTSVGGQQTCRMKF